MAVGQQKKLNRLFFWGRPLSPFYSFIMAKRSGLYESGFLKQHKLEVPVISVGNLVLGGTGKTPLVHYIAEFLQKYGKRPAILSRGYKGAASGPINIVSDPDNILMTAEEAGDEPRLLAEKLPGIPVLTGKKRSVTGRFAIDTYGTDCLILDDGFQHISLKRDLDLVLFNAETLLGNSRVLPGGYLREPLAALHRADAFIINGVSTLDDKRVNGFVKYLGSLYPDKPIFSGCYLPDKKIGRMYNGKNDSLSITECRDIPLYGFCGIAQPDSYYNLIKENHLNLIGFKSFADHHAYSLDDIQSLCDNAHSAGAEALITTEKDIVKVRDLLPKDLPLFILSVRFQAGSGFDQFLLDGLDDFKSANP